MRTDQLLLKPLKSAAIFAAIVLLLVSLATATTTSNNAQDQTFRLMNIERRLDQLQIRMDAIERAFQSQALNNAGSSNISTQALLDLQRTQLAMTQQLVTIQKQMLELKQEIDRQALRETDQGKDVEKKDEPKQEAKPKVQSKNRSQPSLPNTVILGYEDFGPQVMAYELIGYGWNQWKNEGHELPDDVDVKVVVYRGVNLAKVKGAYPVVRGQSDYRYVEYDRAMRFLNAQISELERHKKEEPEARLAKMWDDLIMRLKKTKAAITMSLG
jgi:hypothetical protein